MARMFDYSEIAATRAATVARLVGSDPTERLIQLDGLRGAYKREDPLNFLDAEVISE